MQVNQFSGGKLQWAEVHRNMSEGEAWSWLEDTREAIGDIMGWVYKVCR